LVGTETLIMGVNGGNAVKVGVALAVEVGVSVGVAGVPVTGRVGVSVATGATPEPASCVRWMMTAMVSATAVLRAD